MDPFPRPSLSCYCPVASVSKGKMYTKAYQYQAVFYGTAQSRYCLRVALMRNHDLYGLRAHVFYIELPFVAARYMNQQKEGDYQERIKNKN